MTRINIAQPFVDRGLVASNVQYNPGDIVWYAGRRVQIIDTFTTPTGTPPFISAAHYIPIQQQWWANVKDFGATGNSSTDDTVAIQKAMDWVASAAASTGNGGTVFFPAGFYVTSATLVVGKHVTVRGEGMIATVIKLATNANCDVITNRQSSGSVGNADFCSFVDITFDGNRLNQSDQTHHGLVLATNPTNATASGDSFFDMHHSIRNVRVYRAGSDGFHFVGRSGIEVINAYAQQCNGYGFLGTFDTNFSHCEADSNGLDGFHLNNGSTRLALCKSYLNGLVDATASGFYLGSNCNGVALSSCEAQNNKGRGFYLNGANRISIAACVADSNNTSGPTAGGTSTFPAVELVGSSYNVIQMVCWQGTQGTRVGDQNAALAIDTASGNNSVVMSHSGNGTSVTAAMKAGSVLAAGNSVLINGAAVSAGTY